MPSSGPRYEQEVLDRVSHPDNVTRSLGDPAEAIYLPRTRRLSYYLVLLLVVAPVWSFVPLSWAFIIYVLYSSQVWSFAWRGRLFFAVALCEVRPDDLDIPRLHHQPCFPGIFQLLSLPSCQIRLGSSPMSLWKPYRITSCFPTRPTSRSVFCSGE